MNATKRSHRSGLYQKILSLMITVAMIIGCMPISNVFAKSGSDWTISEDKKSATIEFTGGTAHYYSINPDIQTATDATSGDVAITSSGTNGKVQNASKEEPGRLYQFDQGAYCDFVPKENGTLTLKIANATAKEKDLLDKAIIFGLNKMPMTDGAPVDPVANPPKAENVAGWFVSGLLDTGITGYEEATKGTHSKDGSLTAVQREKYNSGDTTVTIKIDKNFHYFFAMAGSKIRIFDIDFVSDGGTVEPPVEETTEGTKPPVEETTDNTENPGEETTDNTENPGEETTEAPVVSDLPLGAFTGGEVVVINDAVQVLEYVKDRSTFTGTRAMLDAGEVSGDKRITAEDAAQIVAKVKDENFKFTRTDYNPGKPNPPATEETTEKPGEETTEGTPVTPSGTPTLWVLGDSTVCNYTDENVESINWRNGWGMALNQYIDTSKINIKNIALSGRSSRDFRTKDEYKQFTDATNGIKEGDYVLIQFGHNDEKEPLKSDNSVNGNYGKPDSAGGISTAANLEGWKDATKGDGYVAVDGLPEVANSCIVDGKLPSFEAILYKDYVKLALDKGANPILVTPVARASGATEVKGYEVDNNNKEATLRTGYSTASNGGHTAVVWKNTQGMKDKTMNYVQGIKDVAAYAKEQTGKDVPVITLDELSVTAFDAYGKAHNNSINDLMAHNTSNYTKGADGVWTVKKYSSDASDPTKLLEGPFKDGTHLSREGAKLAAGIVIEEIGKTSSGLKAYFKTSSENPGDETTESSSEDSTESSSEDSTESSSEGTTENVPPISAEVSINDVDSFPGYGLVQNNGASVIDMANTANIGGNSTAKIYIGNKAVLKQFDTPATSGKYQFSVDFLTDYDAATAGRTFRIFLENDKSAIESTTTTDTGTFDNFDDALGYITEGNLSGANTFYQLADVGQKAYVVEIDDTGFGKNGTTGGVEAAAFEANKWYHIVVDIDLDAKTTVTKIYSHGDSWAPDTDWAAATPVGTVTSNFVADKTPSLAQVRFVRTAGGNIYFDNVKLAKAE